MKGVGKTYNAFHLASAVFMMLALIWLTISLPFVFAGQQEKAKQEQAGKASSSMDCNDEDNNPFSNSEEKAPSSTSFSEEYLHDHHHTEYFFITASQFYKTENAGTYIAFHGELLVPPPNLS